MGNIEQETVFEIKTSRAMSVKRKATAGLFGAAILLTLPTVAGCGSDDDRERTEGTSTHTTDTIPESNTRILSDGTELPRILAQKPEDVGPATIAALNHWLATNDSEALAEMQVESMNVELDELSEFYDMENIRPGIGEQTPVWTREVREIPRSPIPNQIVEVYDMESGVYFADTDSALFDLRPENGPKPFTFHIEITDSQQITALSVGYHGSDLDAQGRHLYP